MKNQCECDPPHGDLRLLIDLVDAATEATVLSDGRVSFVDDDGQTVVLCKWAYMVIIGYGGDEDRAADEINRMRATVDAMDRARDEPDE